MLKFASAFIFLITLSTHAQELPELELLNSFSAGCAEYGSMSKAAIENVQKFHSYIDAVHDDPTCLPMLGSLEELSQLQEKVKRLQELSETEENLLVLHRNEQVLLAELQATNDPSAQATIKDLLTQNQIEINALDVQSDFKAGVKLNRREHQLTSLIQTTENAMNNALLNLQCLQARPNLMADLTSFSASVASIAAIANPVLAISLIGGTQLLSIVVNNIQKLNLKLKKRKLNQITIAQQAYQCTLKTLSRQWCDTRDSIHIIDKLTEQYQRPNRSTSQETDSALMNAINLKLREVPTFLNWVRKIRAGIEPTNSAEAERKNKVEKRFNLIIESSNKGLGLINENKELIQRETEFEKRWPIAKRVISQIISNEYSGGVKNPLFDLKTTNEAAYFLLGFKREDYPRDETSNIIISFHSFDPFNEDHWARPSRAINYEQLEKRFREWLAEANQLISEERNQVFLPDPLGLISSAHDQNNSQFKNSSYQALEKIITFFSKVSNEEPLNSPFRKVLDETLKKITITKSCIDYALATEENTQSKPCKKAYINLVLEDLKANKHLTEKSPSDIALQTIFSLIQLDFGDSIISDRIDLLLRFALQKYLLNAPRDEQELAAILLAEERFGDVISRLNPNKTFSHIKQDFLNSLMLNSETIDRFTQLLHKNIAKIISILRDKKERKGLDSYQKQAINNNIAGLCYGVLSSNNIPKRFPLEVCYGTRLQAIFSGGPKGAEITQATQNLPDKKRKCLYNDFLRKTYIYEYWGNQ